MKTFFWGLFCCLLLAPVGTHAQVSARDIFLKDLRVLQQTGQKELAVVDATLASILKSSSEIRAVKLKEPEVLLELQNIKTRMEEFGQQREEFLLRQEFLNRLYSLTESKAANSTEMKAFLWPLLLDMASTNLGLQSGVLPQTDIAIFQVYLSIAVRELPEPIDSLARFIDAYMKYSTLLDPKDPTGFAEQYQYVGKRTPTPLETATPTPTPAESDYQD